MSAVSTVREDMANDLRDLLGEDVVPNAFSPSGLLKPILMVRLGSVARGVVPGLRTTTCEVLVISAKVEPGRADDALDALLERTLDAIDASDQLLWTGAERGVFEENYPAYTITVTRED